MAWFQSLELMEQIFAICAVPATVLLVLQTILLLFGLGSVGASDMSSNTSGIGDGGYNIFGDGDADSIDAPHDIGFRMFTVRGLVTFFALFGWTGLVCLQASAKEGFRHLSYLQADRCVAAQLQVALGAAPHQK